MRPLTPDELRLLLERGVEALDDWKPDVIVASLALEVSERRLETATVRPILRDALVSLGQLLDVSWTSFDDQQREQFYRDNPSHRVSVAAAVLRRAAEAGIGEGG